MQRCFEPMRKQVETWQKSELTDVTAKVVIHEAFVEGRLEAPKHLARTVHDLYFEPKYEEFRPRTIWSLSNAFTSTFKELEPIPQFKATAKLGEFLEGRLSQRSELVGRFRPPLLPASIARRIEASPGAYNFLPCSVRDLDSRRTCAQGIGRSTTIPVCSIVWTASKAARITCRWTRVQKGAPK
jgi:hypothetical protein